MTHFRFCVTGLFAFLLVSSPRVYSKEPPIKDEVIAKYEQAVIWVEEQRLSQKDASAIKPRVRLAGQALLNNDFVTADQILEDALHSLEELRKTRPETSNADFRLEWLETYANIFQWYAVLMLLAFFLTRGAHFQTLLLENRFSFLGQVFLAGLTVIFSIFLALFDLSRYGESSWMFFDIQLVLITISGFLGGPATGFLAGLFAAFFRYFLKPGWSIYPFLALGAGLIGGLFSLARKNFQESAKTALAAGLLTGFVHGLSVYLVLDPSVSWNYVVFAIAFLAALEGVGVFLFFAVIGLVLREQVRRHMEHELLKTKLLFLQAQLRPHFFFNALNTIAVICGREKASQAQTLIFRLTDFLRHTLKREDERVTLKEEMAFIDDYLEIEKARFQDLLNIHKEFRVGEKAWDVKIPLLILQPLVENAIGHGLRKKGASGNLWIFAETSEGFLKIAIVDDGVGAEPGFFEGLLQGQETKVAGLGIGVRNIYQRLKRYYGEKGELSFETQKGTGTRVTVKIPFSEEDLK